MRDIRHSKRQRSASASSAYHRDLASWLPHAVATLLILMTFVVFWQVHSYEVVLWDDGLHVFENAYFQSLTFNNILGLCREPYSEFYIPLPYAFMAFLIDAF